VAAWLERQGVHVSFGAAAKSALSFPALVINRLSQEFVPPGDAFQLTRLQLSPHDEPPL